jgi:hypothetical protein
MAVLLAACTKSGTQLTQQRVTEDYEGRPVSDILVIAVIDDQKTRTAFERSFVAHLESAGVEAVSSAEVLPIQGDLKLEKEQILSVVEKFGNDAVMITHLSDIKIEDVSVRAGRNYDGYYGYYGFRFGSANDTGYATTMTTVRLKTNLYDAKTEKLIWSGQSDSWNMATQRERISGVVKVVVNDLKKNKLIAPK